MGDAPRPHRGNQKKKQRTAITTSKTLKDTNPVTINKIEKQRFLQNRLLSMQKLSYDQIVDRYGPVLEILKSGGTFKQAAYAGGMSTEELRAMLEFGRFGGSKGWHGFYEEFFRAKSAAEISVMQNLQNCADIGEKWAIERLMNIMDPTEFAGFDVTSQLPATPANAGITQHFHIQEKFTEDDITDAEVVDDSN